MEQVPNRSKQNYPMPWTLWRPREFEGMGPGFFQCRLKCWCKRSDGPERSIAGWRPGHSWWLLFRVQEKDALVSAWTQIRNLQIRWGRHPDLRQPLMGRFLIRFDRFQKSFLWEIGNLHSILWNNHWMLFIKKNLFTSCWERSAYPNLPCLNRFCSPKAGLTFAKALFPLL